MKMRNAMKKGISALLALNMVLSSVPLPVFAVTEDNLCEHHPVHTAECHYAEAVAGSPCTHEHSEDCYAILECLHTCGDECADGCAHECTVENGCITRSLDCHHTHGDCGYAEAVAPQECTTCQSVLIHAENCGYVAPVAEVACACVPGEDGTLVHTEGCGYVAPVAEVKCACEPTVTHGGEGCTYAEGKDGSPCTHVCEVKVDSADSCYKLLCSHKNGGHDDACGYVAAVEAHECHYECTECEAAAASEEPSEESSEPAPVCYCVEKCTAESFNEYCDVCGVDYSKCTGTDTAAIYTDECAHSFTGGVCDACGEVAVAKIGDTYYATLAEAAAEVTEGGTIEVLTDVTIGEDETLTFAAFATLDVAEGKTVTCSGTVKIGEEDGIIFENTLYYYGGDVTNTRVHTVRVPTYFKAGAGHIITTYDEASNTIMMVMDNATVTTSNGASPVSSNYNLHIQFSGSNTVADTAFNDGISTNSPVSCGIYLDTSEDKMDLTLSGAEGAVLNITAADATGYSYGICAKSVTVTGGTVNITSGNSGSYSYGIFADSVVIHEGATLDLTVGKAENMAIGAGVASNEGTVNGLIMMPDENAALGVVYVASGKTVLIADFTAFDADLPFTVPAGSNLTVNSGVTVDLSVLTADDIDFSGTVINNGTILLPADFGIENAPKGGTVTIGEDSYTWNGEKWICGENNHIGGTATCVAQAVCDICGSSYGELAAHTPDAGGKCTVDGCGYQYAAKVGDTFYETIHKALRAAEGNSGCTLTLLDDITLTSMSSTASYTNQGTFILDLNGKTLSSNKGTLNVLGSADLTIRDSAGGGKIISTYSNAIYQTGGKVTIESGSFEGTLDGVFLSGSSTLIVKGGTFVGSRAMITGFGSDCVIDLTAIDPTGYTLKNNGSGTFAPKLPEGYGMVDSDGKLLASLSAEQSATVHKHEYKYTDLGDGNHQQACSCGLTTGEPAAHSTTADGDSAADCNSKAYCSECDSEYGDVDKTNHDETVKYENGFCPNCDAYEPATDSNSDGVYEISNAGQLYWFAAQVNGGTSVDAILTQDITVNEGVLAEMAKETPNVSGLRAWTPVGNEGMHYIGTFDGAGFTISGLYCVGSAYYVGLFGYVGENGTVKNVGIADSYFFGKMYVGGVAGCNRGTVAGCYNTGTVSGDGTVGGVVGSNQATMYCCYNAGNVICNGSLVGGVVGEAGGAVMRCYNVGTITCSGSYVGGVAGNGNVTDCYYLDTTAEVGVGGSNENAQAEAKTAAQFASGEVACLLNSSPYDFGVDFKQTLGENGDAYPGFTGGTVYQVTGCDGNAAYSNTNENIEHNWVNGTCTGCEETCEHSGGDGNCSTEGTCQVCGAGYLNPDVHTSESFTNGFRDCCGEYQSAVLNDEDVYEISNAGQLYWFARQVNGGSTTINGILTDNIKINENVLKEDGTLNGNGSIFRAWTPIGTVGTTYTGQFEGNGKTVSGLYFQDSSANYVGLFGFLDRGAALQNVTVTDSWLSGGMYVGSLAGFSSVTLKNCHSSGTVTGGSYVGGIVGEGGPEDCSNSGTVTGGSYVGGLTGRGSWVTGCSNSGAVTGVSRVGGIVGSGSLLNCSNSGTVTGSGDYVGGLAGCGLSQVENSFNTGTVTGNDYVGGIAGSCIAMASGRVVGENCFNIGTVTGTGDHVGGIAGGTELAVLSNNYYLADSETDTLEGTTAKSAAQFESGEVAYLLQGEQTKQVWGQNLDNGETVQSLPTLGGAAVYKVGTCGASAYSNTQGSFLHDFEPEGNTANGFCACGEYQSAVQNDDGVYEISNGGQLYWFAQQVNIAGNTTANAMLTADIDLENRSWEPIASYSGTFDGGNYSITNLNVNAAASNAGLFGSVSGTVKDLSVSGSVTVSANDVMGVGVIGVLQNGGVARGITSRVNITVNSGINGTCYIGGVVGTLWGTVTECTYYGNISLGDAAVDQTGGIVAYVEYNATAPAITNCGFYGSITTSNTANSIGGIQGYSRNSRLTLESCLSVGDLPDSGSAVTAFGVINAAPASIKGLYYLEGSAPNATANSGSYSYTPADGSITAANADQLKSGEVAHLLGAAWGQTIGTDSLPLLGGDTVYRVDTCGAEDGYGYSNTNAPQGHVYDANGFCTKCGGYEMPVVNEEGVYEIANAGQLYKFAQLVNGGSYGLNAKLVNNITLNENLLNDSYELNSGDFRTWTPMGNFNNGYSGTFDGQGYRISGLYIPSTETIQGMFSLVTGTVKNVILADTYVQGAGQDGGLVGYLKGGTVSNCGFDGVVRSVVGGGSGGYYSGGVVAYIYGGTIENCFATGKFSSEGNHANPILSYADTNGGAPTLTNNYYLENCSTDSTGTVNAVHCNDGVYATTEVTSVTEEQILSGEVAYLLGGAWGQTCGQGSPYLNGPKVYRYCVCDKYFYTNEATADQPHNYVNGFCTVTPGELHYEPGTDENADGVYEIANGGQLFWFAQQVNTVDRTTSAVLTADIDLEGRSWTPIGSTGENSNNFRGTFDGQNHTIQGLYVEGGRAGLGFFGEVRTGTVKNFTIYGEVVANTEVDYVGGVIGSACGLNSSNHGLERNGAIIQNITSYVNLTAKAHGVGRIGGFVGYANHETLIENCSWYGTFDAGIYRVDNGAGGFIGRIQEDTSNVTIRNCGAYGTIKTGYVKNSYNNQPIIYMGGFLSFSNTNAKTTLENCLFAGKFERGEALTDQAELAAFGTLTSVSAISNCYYLGDDGLAGAHSGSNLQPGSPNVEITSVTGEQLLSGEIALKLGSAWGQTIGTDAYPIPGGQKVYYGYADCKATEKTYANSPLAETEPTHSFDANGFCTVCDSYEPAADTDGDGYYEIDNAGKLYWFAAVVNSGYGDVAQNKGANAVLTDNITVNTGVLNADGTLNGDGSDLRKWTPIGKNRENIYGGTFDGNGKTVSGLYFNDSTADYVGLVGYMAGANPLKNVGVVDSYICGRNYVAGVVGFASALVSGCYSKATVSGYSGVGGVVGDNDTFGVSDCYHIGTVSGSSLVGGVVGHSLTSSVNNCYQIGSVSGSSSVGGVVGTAKWNRGVNSCYHIGTVSGNSSVGGVVGNLPNGNTPTNCYYLADTETDSIDGTTFKTADQFASGEVAYLLNGNQSTIVFKQTIGEDDYPNFTGETVYAITNCAGAGTGAYSNTMIQLPHDYSNNNGFCVVCNAYESAVLNNGVYEIGNAGQLYWFAAQVNNGRADINGKLTADILVNQGVLAEMAKEEPNTESFRVWTPIGDEEYAYTGDFHGLGHTVSGLFFDREPEIGIGLFGYVGSGGSVHHVGVIDSYFRSSSQVGGVVGQNQGTVQYVYNSGTVIGQGPAGGLVGANGKDAIVEHSYNTGTVSGDDYIGGLVGYNSGAVENCYNTGSVSGEGNVGSVIGLTEKASENCYYLADTEGEGPFGTIAKTAAQFASGEVAYLLNGSTSEGTLVWGQNIDNGKNPESCPVFSDAVVYRVTDCDGITAVYSNTNANFDHDYDNGFCIRCDAYEPATDSDSDGYYEIDNAGKLYWFAAQVNGGSTAINGILTDDIVVNEGTMTAESTDARAWTPIVNSSKPYTGTFDGDGKTVSGLYFNDSNTSEVGLFGYLGSGGTVQNVGVMDSYICGKNYVGGVVGVNYGTVTNCYNSGTVSGFYNIGGVVGENGGTVTNCYNSGTVSGDGDVGGVVGYNSSTVSSCYNTGTISGESRIGGVVGNNYYSSVTDCYNTGTVSGETHVGGVVGYDGGNSTVSSCYNTGTVSGEGNYVGGVVGYGGSNSTVSSCYNTGTVSGEGSFIGGVVSHNHGTVTNCSNTGTVSGTYYIGGVVGYNSSTGTATNCYYLDTCGAAGDGTAKNAEQFASGEVAYLLNGDQSTIVFKQTLGTDAYPSFTGETVYGYYTSCAEDAEMVYTNDSTVSAEKPGHTGEVTYTPSADGAQHIANYACCGSQVTQDHTYENGKCPCGAYDLWVAGEQITDSHLTVTGTTGTATYDPATDTLTLNGFDNGEKSYSFTNNEYPCCAAVYSISDLKVVLEGENYLYAEGDGLQEAIWSDAALTIGGDGTLNADTIYSANGTTINGGTLNIIGVNTVFEGPSTTINGGNVNVHAIIAVTFETLTVTGGRVVLETSDAGFGYYGTIVIGEGLAVYDENGVLIENPDFSTLYYALIQAPCDHSGSEHTEATDNGNGTHSFTCTLCGNTVIQDHSFPEGSNGFCLCDAYERAVLNGDVYEISNAGQLYWFMDQESVTRATKGKLMKNITVNENVLTEMAKDTPDTSSFRTWNPKQSNYTSTFDGNGMTISGLYFNDSSADIVGLFGRVMAVGTVQNLTVSDSYICGHTGVGGIVGNNYGTVSNCSYDGTLIGFKTVGGIAGHNEGTLENCSSQGTVTATSDGDCYVGGVVGSNYSPGTVKNCTNKARVTGAQFVGGIVGENRGSITLCRNEASVIGNYTVGGVTGHNFTTITLCTNAGSVLAGPEYGNREFAGSAGGIVGVNENGSTVEKCRNEGSVTATGEGSYNVGGIVAVNSGTVTNCGNEGPVSGAEFVGGVVGSNGSGTVTNCYNIGTVTCTSYGGGGVVGENAHTVEDCYYLDTAAIGGIGNNGGIDGTDYQGQAEARTEAQFKSGEVACLLGDAWGQTIGTENVPVLGGKKVYPVTNCGNQIAGYTNTETSGAPQHSYGDPVYSWTEDPTTLTVTLECTVCSQDVEGHTLSGSTTDMDVTTSADGFTTTYTASVTLNGVTYTDYRTFTNEVKSVEITWGSLEFTYTQSENGEGAWGNADYANEITVKNTGNAAVTVTATYKQAAGYDEIKGIFYASGTAIHTETAEAATTVKFFLGLEGKPKKTMTNATVGTVTVSIQ